MVKFGSVAAFALLSLAGDALAQKTAKVMPFGASIVTVSCYSRRFVSISLLTHPVAMLAKQPPGQVEGCRCDQLRVRRITNWSRGLRCPIPRNRQQA